MSAIYRVRQFVRAAGALAAPAGSEEHLVGRYLPPAGLRLFQLMPAYDRRHTLDVLRTLEDRGHTEPDLLAAALLHDVGKTAHEAGSLQLWHRVAVVLMRKFAPGVLEQMGRDQATTWRQPFYVQQHHAAISAELARQAGCSPRTVELIRRHEEPADPADDPLLAALKAADSEN